MDEQAIRDVNGGYLHREAFCLMQYATKDGSEVEYIWNSRDGVTPFFIRTRSGAEMTHVNWRSDRRIPDYEPQIGERIFVDLTPMRAKILATQNAERLWDTLPAEYREGFGTKADAAERLLADYLREPGSPDLIEVRP